MTHKINNRFIAAFLRHPGYAVVLLLALVAVAGRVAFILDVSSQPLLSAWLPKTDSFKHDLMARNLLLGRPLTLRMPAYPLFVHYLKTVYLLFGTQPLSLYFVHLALSLAAALLLALTGISVFGLWPGMLAGLFYAFYKMNMLYDVTVLETCLSQFLIVAALYFFVRHRARPSTGNWTGFVVTGVLLSVSRVFMWFLVVPVWIYVFIKDRHARNKSYLLLNLGLCCLAIFMAVRFRSPDPYTHRFGFHMYLGSHAQSDGLFKRMKGVHPTYEGFARDGILIAQREADTGEDLRFYWIRKTLRSYWEHPREALRLWARKIKYLGHYYEPHNNASVYFYEKKTVLGKIPRLDYSLIFALAVLGMITAVTRKERGRWLLLPFLFVSLMFLTVFFCSRYRMPMVPFLTLFAGYGAWEIARLAREKKWGPLARLILIGLVCWGWSNLPMTPFIKEKDIGFWEKMEDKRIRRQEKVAAALEKYKNWERLEPKEKMELAIHLERQILPFEFDRVYGEAMVIASVLHDERSRMRLLERRAYFYRSAFDLTRSLEIWEELKEYPAMREIAEKRIRELKIYGPLLNKDFGKSP